ncbi:glycosyltransferase [Halomonas ramblicola]|nr:glycosyltransferase [Halomonas ramblicola]
MVDLKIEVQDSNSTTTVAFALDSGYLDCLKVMLSSMAVANTLVDCPIAIYTDDPEVLEDPVVKLVADKPVLISGKRKEVIYTLARDNVKRPERSAWNKGTFLKWSIFEEQETEQLLFLDVDMLFLNPVEALLDFYPRKSLLTCPQFQSYLKEQNPEANLRAMLEGNFDGNHLRRINSGVMLARKDLLSNGFFDEITHYASQRVAIHEQGLLSDFFKGKSGTHRMVSSAYNFQEHYLNAVSPDVQEKLLNDIAILHYAGGNKPWTVPTSKLKQRKSLNLWHTHKDNAAKIIEFS